MEFELKNFEDKINDITEQFMSLLESKETVGKKAVDKFENAAENFEMKFDIPQTSGTINEANYSNGTTFNFDINNIQNKEVGEIAFSNPAPVEQTLDNVTNPTYAIKFDNDGYVDLNKRLEELYQEKRPFDFSPIEHASGSFSDSNLAAFNNYSYNTSNYTNEKTNSENEKEGYNMANYGFAENDDNSIFSFATVPQERALTAKRSFTDVLFMDIPWDTKIDIWGGFKSLFTTEVRITF